MALDTFGNMTQIFSGSTYVASPKVDKASIVPVIVACVFTKIIVSCLYYALTLNTLGNMTQIITSSICVFSLKVTKVAIVRVAIVLVNIKC